MGEAVGVFQEFAKYPITTVISIIAIVLFLYWFLKERPKAQKLQAERDERERKERLEGQKLAHEDRMRCAEEAAASREVIKNQQVVIDNCTAAIRAQTSSNEALKVATERQMEYMRDFKICAHEDHNKIIETTDEILQYSQKTELIVKTMSKAG